MLVGKFISKIKWKKERRNNMIDNFDIIKDKLLQFKKPVNRIKWRDGLYGELKTDPMTLLYFNPPEVKG